MLFSEQSIYKTRFKEDEGDTSNNLEGSNEEDFSGDDPLASNPPAPELTPSVPLDDPTNTANLPADPNMVDPNMMTPAPSVGIAEVLGKVSTWKDSVQEILDFAIKGSEIIKAGKSPIAEEIVTKEQMDSFASIIEAMGDILLSINDVSFESEKLQSSINLGQQVYSTKKTEGVLKEDVEEKVTESILQKNKDFGYSISLGKEDPTSFSEYEHEFLGSGADIEGAIEDLIKGDIPEEIKPKLEKVLDTIMQNPTYCFVKVGFNGDQATQ